MSCLAQLHLTPWRGRGPGAPEAPPAGRGALEAAPATEYWHHRGSERAAKTTDDRGRFDDESR